MADRTAVGALLGIDEPAEVARVANRLDTLLRDMPATSRLGVRAGLGAVSVAVRAGGTGRSAPVRRDEVLHRLAAHPRLAGPLDLLKMPVLLAAGPSGPAAVPGGGRADAELDCVPSFDWPARWRTDAVVIGSGAGGAMAARTLARAGLDVVVLEEGRRHTVAELRTGNPMDRFRSMYRDAGSTVALGRPPVVLPVGRGVGGTTLVNSGTCFRTPDHVLARWESEHGVPTDRYAELLDEVERTLAVAPHPEHSLGNNGLIALRGARELGWEAAPLRRNATGCAGSGQCAVGCPRNAKNAVHLNALPQACADGARIVTEARVLRVLVEHGRAAGVLARRPDGSSFTLRAPLVVVAAGTTETPPLLRRSGLGHHPGLGRGMAVHPATSVAGRFDEPVVAWRGVMQSVGVEELHDQGVLIEATAAPKGLSTFVLPGLGATLAGWRGAAEHLAFLGAMIADQPSGRVRGSGAPMLTYRLAPPDAVKLRTAIVGMGRILFAAGARQVLTGLTARPTADTPGELVDIVAATPTSALHVAAFHPTGSARMGADARHAPVDSHGALRGVGGLYIADGSVLPTCPEVNPQLTIMATALAVAENAVTRESGRAPGCGSMTCVDPAELTAFLAKHPPFDSLGDAALRAVAEGSRVDRFADGELVLDAFRDPSVEVFVVLEGRVHLWNDADDRGVGPDEIVPPGGVFGFSAMLTESSVGPRAMAVGEVRVARIPSALAGPVFTSRRGARFLAGMVSAARRPAVAPTYSTVDELIINPPLVVEPSTPVDEVARLMTERRAPCAVVRFPDGALGLITDSLLRTRVLVEGRSPSTPAHAVADISVPVTVLGDSAAEALLLLLERDAEFLLVTDRAGKPRGVICPRDFAVSPTTAGVSLHERLRRAGSVDDLACHARAIPAVLADLLSRGLASGRVIAVYSTVVDTLVRRAIGFVFAERADLSVDAFTWLSLGSNGRREAVLSSDVDSAVAFQEAVTSAEITRYREAFGDVYRVLARAGLSGDEHGAIAQHPLFARTNDDWRAAGLEWRAAPEEHNGAMMTSLLVDGRPIHGDPGLPAVTRVFGDLRASPGTMRLLLRESLSKRAKSRSTRHLLTRQPDTFDIKAHALLPIVNIARWAALSVGSAALPTTERLRAAAGSTMLPEEHASTLVEVFGVLQRLRLRYQLMQQQAGDRPCDLITMNRMSSIDRCLLSQAVREISSVQRRMDNVSRFVPAEGWAAPEPAR